MASVKHRYVKILGVPELDTFRYVYNQNTCWTLFQGKENDRKPIHPGYGTHYSAYLEVGLSPIGSFQVRT